MRHGTHEWALEQCERFAQDPYEGLEPEERAARLKWDTRKRIDQRLTQIMRAEPTALYLDEIPHRRKTAQDLLGPGETLEPVFDGIYNEWPASILDGPSRSPQAINRRVMAGSGVEARLAAQNWDEEDTARREAEARRAERAARWHRARARSKARKAAAAKKVK